METAKSSPGSCSGGPAPLRQLPARVTVSITARRATKRDTRTDLIAARLVRRDPSGRKAASAALGGGPAQEEAEPASSGVGTSSKRLLGGGRWTLLRANEIDCRSKSKHSS